MSTIIAWHLEGDRFAVSARDHVLTVDQPVADGGEDTAPTPTELSSLASSAVSRSTPAGTSPGTASLPTDCR